VVAWRSLVLASCAIPKEVEPVYDTAKPVELVGTLSRPSGVLGAAPKSEIAGIVASRRGPGAIVRSRVVLRTGSPGGQRNGTRVGRVGVAAWPLGRLPCFDTN